MTQIPKLIIMVEKQNNEECCKRSFASSIKDTAKRIFADPRIAPKAVSAGRMTICESCEHYIPEKTQCSICQCIMPIKTTLANMRCPKDKWVEYNFGQNENRKDDISN